jgi:hypothetical protein
MSSNLSTLYRNAVLTLCDHYGLPQRATSPEVIGG